MLALARIPAFYQINVNTRSKKGGGGGEKMYDVHFTPQQFLIYKFKLPQINVGKGKNEKVKIVKKFMKYILKCMALKGRKFLPFAFFSFFSGGV
jgi:hypothetical protein